MYRYSSNNAITYTPEDLLLFRESPFASWMERLTLEQPDHGIVPDREDAPAGQGQDSHRCLSGAPLSQATGAESVDWREFSQVLEAPAVSRQHVDDKQAAEIFHAEGKDVVVIEWYMSESQRRIATLEAMRSGVECIVNGQLAVGSMSCSVNLLLRSGGTSDLGNYLYIPCDTVRKETLHLALHLCFAADMLSFIQGALPPQMLIIRAGSDMVTLQSEEHIHSFRAIKRRFMASQLSFRAHRMPDPADSSHFGRWTRCAQGVLKRRFAAQERKAELDRARESDQLRSAGGASLPDNIVSVHSLGEGARLKKVERSQGASRLDAAPISGGRAAHGSRQALTTQATAVVQDESLIDRDTPDAGWVKYAGQQRCPSN